MRWFGRQQTVRKIIRHQRESGSWRQVGFKRRVAARSPPAVVASDSAIALGRTHQRRSEEHTSELQSLMRISYAVFCLKKKTTTCPLLDTIYTHFLLHRIYSSLPR